MSKATYEPLDDEHEHDLEAKLVGSSSFSGAVPDDDVPRSLRRTTRGDTTTTRRWTPSRKVLGWICLIQLVVNGILGWKALVRPLIDASSCKGVEGHAKSNAVNIASSAWPQTLYSPAQEAVEQKIVRFYEGFGNLTSPYQGRPSKEMDERWLDLYDLGISKVSKAEAEKMVNKTWPLTGEEEGQYVVGIDVFHQLHCLNMLRKQISPDYYTPMNISDAKEFEHLSHCVDSIRQSLMCTSDVSNIVWQWDTKSQAVKIHADVPHTCRDFDKIHKWAEDHRLMHPIDYKKKIEDDIVIAPF